MFLHPLGLLERLDQHLWMSQNVIVYGLLKSSGFIRRSRIRCASRLRKGLEAPEWKKETGHRKRYEPLAPALPSIAINHLSPVDYHALHVSLCCPRLGITEDDAEWNAFFATRDLDCNSENVLPIMIIHHKNIAIADTVNGLSLDARMLWCLARSSAMIVSDTAPN